MGFESELMKPDMSIDEVVRRYRCLIISGGSWSLPEDIGKLGNAPQYVLNFPGPVLGICLGHQLMAYLYGGRLTRGLGEFGGVRIHVDDEDTILRGVGEEFLAWESHNISVLKEPPGFRVIAHSDRVPVEAMVNEERLRFSVQFHPEVKHTQYGDLILRNFATLCM